MTTRTSQDKARPSSRLDSEGEEEEEDTDKVRSKYLVQFNECNSMSAIQYSYLVQFNEFRSLQPNY